MIAQCDNCGMPTTIEYKVKKHEGTVRETYFTCDHCQYHFTCFVTDNKVRKAQAELKRLRQSGKVHSEVLIDRQNKINKRMKQLKDKVMQDISI